jgi:hypothetical protein
MVASSVPPGLLHQILVRHHALDVSRYREIHSLQEDNPFGFLRTVHGYSESDVILRAYRLRIVHRDDKLATV